MSTFTPYDYQEEAVESVYQWWRDGNRHPLVVAPTGSGKSIIQAMLVKKITTEAPGTRILLLSHVKELLEQNAKQVRWLHPWADIGFCSAGIGKRQFVNQVLVAGIQTVHKYAHKVGHVDIAIIDEAHLMSEKGDTMYRRFIADLTVLNPRLQIVGLTATPFRLSSGLLYGKEDSIFGGVCYDIPIQLLIERGKLSRITGRNGITKVDLSSVHTRGGEYIEKELQAAFDQDELNHSIVAEVVAASRESKKILLFSTGVQHGHHLKDLIAQATGERVEMIDGKTPKKERERLIHEYKSTRFRWLVNCATLTTGFDCPDIDLLVLCRATQSAGLYMQIVGRGMRIAKGKERCVVLDYGGNIERFGPIDKIKPKDYTKGPGGGDAPVKECPECISLLHLSVIICPECGYEFPKPDPKLDHTASGAAVISDDIVEEIFEVYETTYAVHQKQGKPDSFRVSYRTGVDNISEWVCFDHAGFARRKAEKWATKHGVVPPASVEAAMDTSWPNVSRIKAKKDGKFYRVIGWEFDGTWSIPNDQFEAEQMEIINFI